MKAFEQYNPIVITVYFLLYTLIAVCAMHPILLLIAFLGMFLYFLLRNGRKHVRMHLLFFGLFLLLSAVNPLFSHNGKTVLFFIDHIPVTAEAAFYGVVSTGTFITVLYAFRLFNDIMTRDKLLYVFGRFSPKSALIFSMGLRYVPLFRQRAKKIAAAQKAIGLYKKDNILDKIKGDLRVFSILVTWVLENGVTTADSMAARGYGRRRRTHFQLFRFRSGDAVILLLTVLLFGITAAAYALGALAFSFYPTLSMPSPTPLTFAAYGAYACMALLPSATEIKEKIKWKYLQSKM